MIRRILCMSLMMSALAILICFSPVFAAPAAGKPIRIGIIGPMDIRTGVHMMLTGQMAADKINAAGGVRVGNTKRRIELVKISSNEFKKVTDAVSAAERAITVDKVDILIGGIMPEAVSAIQDIAADNKTLYFSSSYSISRQYVERMTKDYERYKYCFAMSSAEPADIGKLHFGILEVVSKAVQDAGVAKVRAAQMVEKSAGGDAIMYLTSIVFPKIGLESVGIWRPSPAASDLRAETAAIKSLNPHIIYTVFSSSGGIIFGKQVAELKVPAIVAGSPASSLFPGKGIDYSVTLMTPGSIPIKITDKNVPFYNEFLKRSGGELCAASAYDIILSLARNIESAGTLDADTLIKALETNEYQSIGGPVKFDPKDHRLVILNGFRPVYGVQHLPGGKAAIVWPRDAIVQVSPVQIPPWMIVEWKKTN